VSAELVIFARFDAAPRLEAALAEAISRVVIATRNEPGCLEIHGFRGTRAAARMIIHSRWRDAAAFEEHARLPHTVEFLERVRTLITHELDITRTTRLV
jgi:quinol monooxygenase YgiN